ncbi:MAG TPA: tripartite tricarboxylate transporter TctB family protein [Ramlibacter sp.]|nr:tripartite tricarboxylate transporter TctB family protein [Ramlibacter sp.]
MESAPEGAVSPRADLVSALVWAAIGLGITVGAWRMDRLEKLNINKYEVPGLVPGLLGAALLVLSLLLAARALRQGALRPAGAPAPGRADTRRYMAIVLGAMLAYSLVLVGHGIPFWLATLVFVAAFIFFFDRERQSELGRSTAKQALLALVYGAGTSAVVSLSFQNIFYVRLP